MILQADGNMFDYEHDCYVNTINCVGAMGAGIALEFKKMYPDMYKTYRRLCAERELAPGDCWVYHAAGRVCLANLAVKNDFRNRIRVSWAKIAVRNFCNRLIHGSIPAKNVALPRIGSKNGGRGMPFENWNDNWPDDSEKGYVEKLEPFLLAELERVGKILPSINFTIYEL